MKRRTKILIAAGILLAIPLLIAAAVILSMLLSDARRKTAEKRIIKQGGQSAIRYVEEKYGFTPTVLEAKPEIHGALFDSWYTGKAFVTATDGETEFTVYLDAETGTGGCDTYQSAEIEQAICAELNRSLPGGTVKQFTFRNSETDLCAYAAYYDGSNLDAILKGLQQKKITVYYTNTDFGENLPAYDWLTAREFSAELLSFDSSAHMQQALTEEHGMYSWYYAPELTDARTVNPSKNASQDFAPAQYDCLYYMPDILHSGQGNSITVSKTDADALVQDVQASNTKLSIPPAQTDAYLFAGERNSYYIYYPVSGLHLAADKLPLAVLSYTDSNGETRCTTRSMEIFGDYAFLEVSAVADLRFAIVQSE